MYYHFSIGKMDNCQTNTIKSYESELAKLGEKFGVIPIATLEFPQYRILPDEVLLALKIIEKHGYKIMLSYKFKEKQ